MNWLNAIRERADAHLEAMQTEDEDINRRYQDAVKQFEETERRWLNAFNPSGRPRE
jgi:hypothetical protein